MNNESKKESKLIIICICIIAVVLIALIGIAYLQRGNVTRTLKKQTTSDIKYDKEKLNIYFFWGDGCEHCEALISFLNSLTEDYDKYFDLYTLEVWYNEDNNKLMTELTEELGKEVKGIPCLIIGDQVFSGFSEDMKEDIKKAIKKEYKENPQYDVYNEYKKN